MPRQNYYEPRQRRGDNRLEQLAALAQIYGGLSGQGNQQQQAQQQNALAILGLMLSQQNQQGQLGLRRDEQTQQGLQFKSQQDQEAAKLGLLERQGQQKLEADKADREAAQARAGLTNYASLPGATLEGYSKLAEAANTPGFAPFNAANREALLNSQLAAMQQQFGSVYGQYADKPRQSQAGLNALWQDPRMQSPEVQVRIQPFLQAQDEGLYKGPQAGGTFPPPNIPPNLQPQIDAITAAKVLADQQAEAQRQADIKNQERTRALQYIMRNSTSAYAPQTF